jgi:hypothetical protein
VIFESAALGTLAMAAMVTLGNGVTELL